MEKSLLYTLITAHAIFVLLIVVGFFTSFKVKILRPILLGVLIILLILWKVTGGCPVTVWEAHLLQNAGQPTNLAQVGFIPYYLKLWLHINFSPQLFTILSYLVAIILVILTIDWIKDVHQKQSLSK